MTLSPTTATLLIGVPEAARLLCISTRGLHRLAKIGALPCVRLGGRVLFRPEALAARLAELESGGKGGAE